MAHGNEVGSWDRVWEQIFRSREWGKYPSEHVVRFVAQNWYGARDRSAVKLLDLGCGPGASVWYMAREGFTVSGIDGSPTAIRLACARLQAEHLTADLREGDYSRLPWPDAFFDGVIENESLCCNPFAASRQVLAEVHRVLKPGGKLLSLSFGSNCTGRQSGCEVEPNGYAELKEGPLAHAGFVRLMDLAQIHDLYSVFPERSVERATRTASGMQHLIEEWIIVCRKQP